MHEPTCRSRAQLPVPCRRLSDLRVAVHIYRSTVINLTTSCTSRLVRAYQGARAPQGSSVPLLRIMQRNLHLPGDSCRVRASTVHYRRPDAQAPVMLSCISRSRHHATVMAGAHVPEYMKHLRGDRSSVEYVHTASDQGNYRNCATYVTLFELA